MGGEIGQVRIGYTTVDLYDNDRGWHPDADPRGSFKYLVDDPEAVNGPYEYVSQRLVESVQRAVDDWYEHFGKHVLKTAPDVIL